MRTWIVAVAVLTLATAGIVVAAEIPVEVQVSPATIVLGAPCTWVTIHTDIPAAGVVAGTVELNGVVATIVKADARGNLVGKFDFDAITADLSPGEAVMDFAGAYANGDTFVGSSVVPVRER